MRVGLLPRDRVRAIQEEIAGFLLDHVIAPTGEFFHPHFLEDKRPSTDVN